MYDILQLNDMLVPELLDIAEHLDIADAGKLNKQDLIYRILDKQALTPAAATATAEKPKRKRTVKASTANTTEEAEVMTDTVQKPAKENRTCSRRSRRRSGGKTTRLPGLPRHRCGTSRYRTGNIPGARGAEISDGAYRRLPAAQCQ